MPNDMTALPALPPSDMFCCQFDGEDSASIRSVNGVGALDDKAAFGSGIVGANPHGRARASRAVRLRAWICDHFPRFAAFVGIKRAGKDDDIEKALLRSQLEAAHAQNEANRLLIEQLGKELAKQTLNREEQQTPTRDEAFINSLFATLRDAKMQAGVDEVMARLRDLEDKADAAAAVRNSAPDSVPDCKPSPEDYNLNFLEDSDSLNGEADPSICDADQAMSASPAVGGLKMDESCHSVDSGYSRSRASPVERDAEDIHAESAGARAAQQGRAVGVLNHGDW